MTPGPVGGRGFFGASNVPRKKEEILKLGEIINEDLAAGRRSLSSLTLEEKKAHAFWLRVKAGEGD